MGYGDDVNVGSIVDYVNAVAVDGRVIDLDNDASVVVAEAVVGGLGDFGATRFRVMLLVYWLLRLHLLEYLPVLLRQVDRCC